MRKNIIQNLSTNLFASYSHALRTVIDTIPLIYNWQGKTMSDAEGNPYTWNKGGGEAGRATNAENKEKMFAGRGALSYQLNPAHTISVNYLFNHFTRDVDDPYMMEQERELSDTRYLTKGIMGISYNNNLLDERLQSSLFYKHYTQTVKLKDFKKDKEEIVAVIHDRTTHNSGFGAAFSYELFPKILILLSGEKALRLPESTEILGNTSQNIETSYDLKPEQSTNLNIGFNLGMFQYKQHRIGLDVNFFYRDVRDMITRKVSNDTTTDMTGYENLGEVLSKGMDIELKYIYNDKINFTSDLSSFNARFNQKYDETGSEHSYYKMRLRNAPYLTWNNMLEYSIPDFLLRGSHVTFSYCFNYVHQFFRNWELYGGTGKAIIPTQAVHDFGLNYSFPGHRIILSFDAKNFTNEQVFDNWALQKPGRAFYAKISYRIF